MSKWIMAVFVVALSAVWLASAPAKEDKAAASASLKIGQPAPAFTLKDQDGKDVQLSDLSGKTVVLEWINPECPYVKRHYKLGTMKALAEKYAGKEVVWLAVNSTKSATSESNKQWISQHALGYPILDDSAGTVGRLYGAKTTPHMYIIDKEGKLVYNGAIDSQPVADGPARDETINYVSKALDEVLDGKSVSTSETKPYGCSVKYRS